MLSGDLRYPIGRMPSLDVPVDAHQHEERIRTIETLPQMLRDSVAGFSAEQWHTPYRPGGWTVRQLVHHVADSHMNACVRFKLALTEDEPTIKPYEEAAWAELPDVYAAAPEVSLALLDALHTRWGLLLRGMTETDYARTLHHPDHGRTFTLEQMLALYAWHSAHHLAHITALAERSGWR